MNRSTRPIREEAWLQRARRLQNGGCFDQAIYCYQQGLEQLLPSIPATCPCQTACTQVELLLGQADCYLALQRPEMALVKLDRCCRHLVQYQRDAAGDADLDAAIHHLLQVWPHYQHQIGLQRPQLGQWMTLFSGVAHHQNSLTRDPAPRPRHQHSPATPRLH